MIRIFVLSSSSSDFWSIGIDHLFCIWWACSVKVGVDGLAVVDGVKQLVLENLDGLIRWKLQSEEARPTDWESCLSSCLIQLNRVVLNDFFFLQRQSCSAPNESKIADFFFVGEALQDLPESLDDLMCLRAVSVCCQLLQSFNAYLIHANYSVFQVLPAHHSQEFLIESLVNSID